MMLAVFSHDTLRLSMSSAGALLPTTNIVIKVVRILGRPILPENEVGDIVRNGL